MTDQLYGDHTRLLRMPELRMLGVRHAVLRLSQPFSILVEKPGMTCFYHLLRGRLRLLVSAGAASSYDLDAGASVGFEDGKHHRLASLDGGSRTPDDDGAVEVVTGYVDRRHTALQRMTNSLILVPPDAKPFSTVIGHCARALRACEPLDGADPGVIRRFAEVIQLQMMHFAEAQLQQVGPIPDAVRLDAPLLRAWQAFLSAPHRRWTVASLAAEAGISRTAFTERFQRRVGTPPLETLRWLRMRYAADMLQTTQAPVSEIALRVGYGSEEALMRAFRREFGTTPSQWRTNGGPQAHS